VQVAGSRRESKRRPDIGGPVREVEASRK
jgi:hypothetical protein